MPCTMIGSYRARTDFQAHIEHVVGVLAGTSLGLVSDGGQKHARGLRHAVPPAPDVDRERELVLSTART